MPRSSTLKRSCRRSTGDQVCSHQSQARRPGPSSAPDAARAYRFLTGPGRSTPRRRVPLEHAQACLPPVGHPRRVHGLRRPAVARVPRQRGLLWLVHREPDAPSSRAQRHVRQPRPGRRRAHAPHTRALLSPSAVLHTCTDNDRCWPAASPGCATGQQPIRSTSSSRACKPKRFVCLPARPPAHPPALGPHKPAPSRPFSKINQLGKPIYAGFIDCIRQTHRALGLRGFFRGIGPCLLRAFPANAAAFGAYEAVKAALERQKLASFVGS